MAISIPQPQAATNRQIQIPLLSEVQAAPFGFFAGHTSYFKISARSKDTGRRRQSRGGNFQKTRFNHGREPWTEEPTVIIATRGLRNLVPQSSLYLFAKGFHRPLTKGVSMRILELKLELIQPHMTQKPVLRGEVGTHALRM